MSVDPAFGGVDVTPPDRELYKIAVDEYRFQVRLNWSRTQYLLGFNAGVLAVGAGLLSLEEQPQHWLVVAVFGVGLLVACHAIIVTHSQHGYYKHARDHMQRVGRQAGLGDSLLGTTPGMSGENGRVLTRLGRVTSMHYLLFGLLGAIHAAGMLAAWPA